MGSELRDLTDICGAGVVELSGDARTAVASVTQDSRAAGPGFLFACVPGATTDGHDHAAEAVANGAVALMVERSLPLPVPQLRVRSTRAALGPVAAALCGHPSRRLAVLGVTGTNGKTTVTWLLDAIATAAGLRTGVIGTTGVRIAGQSQPSARTTPEAPEFQALLARMADVGAGVAAVEVSSHALVLGRVDGTSFAAACFTNLSHEHLDFHGDLEGYFAAKALLFTPERARAAAVNLDDPYGVRLAHLARRRGLPVTGFSTSGPPDPTTADACDLGTARAEEAQYGPSGTTFRLVTPQGTAVVRSPLVGPFNVSNALAAAATALVAGLGFDAVRGGLEAPLTVPGRMERIAAGQLFPVLVDYAHTPDALEHVLAAARPLAGHRGRLVVVFGCGGDRDRAKRPAMGAAAAAAADVVVITSDNPRSEDPAAIAAEVLAGASRIAGGPARVSVVLDRRAAIAVALAGARAGDVVVIAGKGHETGQTAGGITVPFDDRVVAREELERLSVPATGGAGGSGSAGVRGAAPGPASGRAGGSGSAGVRGATPGPASGRTDGSGSAGVRGATPGPASAPAGVTPAAAPGVPCT